MWLIIDTYFSTNSYFVLIIPLRIYNTFWFCDLKTFCKGNILWYLSVFSFHRTVYLFWVWSDLGLQSFLFVTGSHSVALSGLALPEILLPLPPKNWDLRSAPPRRAGCFCDLPGGSHLADLFCCADTTAFSTFLIAVTICLRRSPLRKEGITVTHSLRVQSIVAGKAWGQGWFAALAAGTCGCLLTSQWTQKHRGECQYPLFPFVSSRSSA